MKKLHYFSHDYNARNDRRMQALVMAYGMEGVGVYWCIIEMLYENGGYLPIGDSECDRIAFELRTQCDLVAGVLRTELFRFDEQKFWSDSVLERLDEVSQKSKKASQSARKRWGDANAMRPQCDRNANKVKESKVKESKVKEDDWVFPAGWESPELRKALDDWQAVRKRKTPKRSTSKIFAKFASCELLLAAVEHCEANGYQGLKVEYGADMGVRRNTETFERQKVNATLASHERAKEIQKQLDNGEVPESMKFLGDRK